MGNQRVHSLLCLFQPLMLRSPACRVGQLHEPDLMVLRAGGRQRLVQEKVYIEYLHISQLQITLSFMPSPGVHPPTHVDSSLMHMFVHTSLQPHTIAKWLHGTVAPREALAMRIHSMHLRSLLCTS